MKTILIAALAAAVSPTLTMAQTAASEPQGVPAADTPLLGAAKAAPDCGNLHGLNGRAFCVTAPLAGVGALFGEDGFGLVTRIVTSALEGGLFSAFVVMGMGVALKVRVSPVGA